VNELNLKEVTTLNLEIFDHSVELTAIITLQQTFFFCNQHQNQAHSRLLSAK
jgi:hypothetical protein